MLTGRSLLNVQACSLQGLHSAADLFISGGAVESSTRRFIDVKDPATQTCVNKVPEITVSEFEQAVESCKTAGFEWRTRPIPVRQRVMHKFLNLIHHYKDDLAACITEEQGKTLSDAHGDVFRGLEVVEAASAVGHLLHGKSLENVASGIDCHSVKQPLGIVAGICPFNFPGMVPLWMFPIAIACGNSFILKPSEKVPGAAMMLTDLIHQAGLPPGMYALLL
eukprot:jgi/Ulvmu1/7235/UM035_0022.1